RSLVEWYEGDGGGTAPSGDGSTWQRRNHNGLVSWVGGFGGAAGSDYANAATDTESVTTTGTYTSDVTADVQDLVDGTATNYGWWIIGLAGQDGFWKHFASRSHPTEEWRPNLEITYTSDAMIGTTGGAATVTGSVAATGYLSGSAAGEASASANLINNALI